MQSVTVLQARTASSRLPGKALLPIGSLPMAVLAARRAANTGRRVILATSIDSGDDALAATARAHGLDLFRGPLDDVLRRVVGAVEMEDDDAIICRLTADNVFPDGAFLDAMQEEFEARRLDYLCSGNFESGLPYGMSAELTRLGHLREAERSSRNAFDREHVTPFVRRRFGAVSLDCHRDLQRGLDRCTVDSLDDYLRVVSAFDGVDDAVRVSWRELVNRLGALPDAPLVRRPVADLVLGGAQLGMSYGIANTRGQPSAAESESMIKLAAGNGVRWIDTARAYGQSEDKIGDALARGWRGRICVSTKVSPLAHVVASATADVVRAEVDASIHRSCSALRVRRLDAVLLHRAEHLDAWRGAAWSRLLELRGEGTVGMTGVSVQSPAELSRALREPQLQWLQMPFNLLDWRWRDAVNELVEARAHRSLTVHVRGALLQGLLGCDDPTRWRRAHVDRPDPVRQWLEASASALGRRNVVDLCFAFVRSHDWIDGVVVGADGADQLRENILLFAEPPLDRSAAARLCESAPKLSGRSLDPSTWEAA